jgi:hypothetical protein
MLSNVLEMMHPNRREREGEGGESSVMERGHTRVLNKWK